VRDPIDIEASLDALEDDFQRWLVGLPANMPRVAAEALDRMAIRPERPAQWTRRLSPLVALYPMLQGQAVAPVSPEGTRELCLAHLQLTVHAFLSDRQLDGQLVLTPQECVLSTQALLAGAATLDLHSVDERASRAATLSLLRRYHHAQLTGYDDERCGDRDHGGTAERLVAARALLGWLATRALLERAPALCARAEEAYARLVVGLQWTDDLVDWSQDLERGQENLLLRQLQLQPLDAVAIRDVDLERRLIEEGVYGHSFAMIELHLRRAQQIQRELGAAQLASLIGELRSEMDALRRRLATLVSADPSGLDLGRRSSG
jgi:hypothetical protein